MTITRKFVLVVEGDTEDDYERALEEAIKQVREGYLVGANRDDCSAYYITSTALVAEQERPYRG